MRFIEISKPIAIRTFSTGSDDVLVTIGKPKLFDYGDDYYCPYAIEFLG